MRFTVRSAGKTIGYGIVTEILENFDIAKFLEERRLEKKARKKAFKEAEEEVKSKM